MWRQGPFVRDVDDISVAAKEKSEAGFEQIGREGSD